jgi:hypothetical protein
MPSRMAGCLCSRQSVCGVTCRGLHYRVMNFRSADILAAPKNAAGTAALQTSVSTIFCSPQ